MSVTIALLIGVAASVGLFWQTPGKSFPFTTVRGQTVEICGIGLYRCDTVFSAAGYRGTDLVLLCLGVPLLLVFAGLYRRGSLRGAYLLTGILSFVLYVYASMAVGAAYNPLFLIYVAIFSLSFFALVLLLRSEDLTAVPAAALARLPRRFPAVLLLGCGGLTLFVWLSPILGSLVSGRPPERLDSYTTLITYALDLALITPSTFIAAGLILRRSPLGYVMAFSLLGIIIMLVPAIIASTIFQVKAGVSFTTGEMVGPAGGFVLLGLLAAWVLTAILRQLPDQGSRALPGQSFVGQTPN